MDGIQNAITKQTGKMPKAIVTDNNEPQSAGCPTIEEAGGSPGVFAGTRGPGIGCGRFDPGHFPTPGRERRTVFRMASSRSRQQRRLE